MPVVTRSQSQGAIAVPDGLRRRDIEVPAHLLTPCCLRCLKRAHQFSTMDDCNGRHPSLRKCGYCSRLGKPCLPIPPRYIKVANKIFIQLDNVINVLEEENGGPLPAVREELRLDVDAVAADVEAFLRKEAKKGLRHKPKGEEINVLALEQYQLLNKNLEKMIALKRYELELGEEEPDVEFLDDIETGALGLGNWPLDPSPSPSPRGGSPVGSLASGAADGNVNDGGDGDGDGAPAGA